jgi:hypothetical protein
MAEVATTKLFENEKMIVWEMILEPGESTGTHKHSNDYVVYVLEGSKLDVFDEHENFLLSGEFAAGTVGNSRLVDEELVDGEFRVPATHSAKNVGATRFREILIETK